MNENIIGQLHIIPYLMNESVLLYHFLCSRFMICLPTMMEFLFSPLPPPTTKKQTDWILFKK